MALLNSRSDHRTPPVAPSPSPSSEVGVGPACDRPRRLGHYFALSYVVIALLCLRFLGGVDFRPARAGAHAAAIMVTYPMIYLLPTMLLTGVAGLLRRFVLRGAGGAGLVFLAATATATATIGYLFVDVEILRLYGFHVNGFVINLLTTRGGIESLGMSSSTVVVAGGGVAAIFGFQAFLYWLAGKLPRGKLLGLVRRPSYRACLGLLFLLSAAERVTYGIGHVRADLPILFNAEAYPLYSGLTFDRLAERLGFTVQGRSGPKFHDSERRLTYPRQPLEMVEPARPLNIVWLVAESWRADALDPEIMPETWAFAARAQRFTQHLSGGNGTRMGVFSMFYGLYAPYWFSVLTERRGPVLVQALLAQDYQLSMYTSAHFTYPEFDQTVFADVPAERLTECAEGPGWQRDRTNVGHLLEFIEGRDRSRPFMTFLFFESPHAQYYFPDESVIREPYLEDFNYATMSLEDDIELIRNRYLNSCHHLDSQFGRVMAYLERESLLDDTIVVVTGDHGEEFMERGHWGHGSTYVDEQIHVPLVLWVPGRGAGRVDHLTSHLDLPATILPLLGVSNDPADLSLGYDVFAPRRRTYAVAGDWSRICYVGPESKAIFPYKTNGLFRSDLSGRDDEPLADDDASAAGRNQDLVEILADLGRFRAK